jgi:hypothetical protein
VAHPSTSLRSKGNNPLRKKVSPGLLKLRNPPTIEAGGYTCLSSLTRPRRSFRVTEKVGCSGFRFVLFSAPSRRSLSSGSDADFVCGYSCGAATDLNRLPQNQSRHILAECSKTAEAMSTARTWILRFRMYAMQMFLTDLLLPSSRAWLGCAPTPYCSLNQGRKNASIPVWACSNHASNFKRL